MPHRLSLMNASETIVLLAAANAAVQGVMLAARRSPRAGDRRLGQFLIVMAVFLGSYSLDFFPRAAAIPACDIGYVVLVYVLTPAFYLFAAERSSGRAARWTVIHAAPGAAALALCALALPWLLSPPPPAAPTPWPVAPIQAFADAGLFRAQAPIYLFLCLRAVRSAKWYGPARLRERRLLLASLAVFCFAWAVDAAASLAVLAGGLERGGRAWLALRSAVLFGISAPSFGLGYIELAASAGRGSPARALAGRPSAAFDAIAAFVDRERPWLDPDCGVEDLARGSSLSVREVSKAVRAAEGRGTSAFLNARRIEEARRLMVERPEAQILDIALDCGFGAKSTFNRVFKEIAGETPTEYRERIASGGLDSGSGTKGGLARR